MIPDKKNGGKWKILWYGDLGASTGFNTVSKNILDGLYKTGKFDIHVLAINNWGEPCPEQSKYKIYPAINNQNRHPYGPTRVRDFLLSKEHDFDIFFTLQDTFVISPFIEDLLDKSRRILNKKFISILYFPIDGTPKKEWVNAVKAFDCPVVYTEYGYNECVKLVPELKDKLSIIPHGANTDEFYPLPEDFKRIKRREYFVSIPDINDKFVFFRIDRNQRRKDYPKLLMAFKEFLSMRKDAVLYLHCMSNDPNGWNLLDVSTNLGLKPGKDIVFTDNFNINSGFPVSAVNKMYNLSDCCITTARGGGFELINMEAMATKTPIIVPNNTCFTEIIGSKEQRGYLVDCGNNINNWDVMPNDNDVIRPVVDVNSLVEKMVHVYDNRDEAAKKADVAYNWVCSNLNWEKHIVPKWLQLIASGLNVLNGDSLPINVDDKEVSLLNSFVL